jgi:peptidyl-tRNA hydrolase
MHLVVRKDHALGRGQAMALAGAGAVRCVDELAESERWAAAFRAWRPRPRKVALRASAEELEGLRRRLDGVAVESDHGLSLLCLPPRRRSDVDAAVVALAPYTDPPRRADPPAPPAGPLLRYVLPRGVLRTTGKAMAQAGHAALECADELGRTHAEAFAAWRAAGRPGEVRLAEPGEWARVRAAPGAVVVSDAGLTQVAPGTETVAALAPAPEPPELVAGLELLP